MILSQVHLQGYRNFKDATINLNKKSLIIGKNDVGKTNLMMALRLLLDRSLSDFDLEPKDLDFFVFEETNTFKILLSFTEVTDDCVVSKLKGFISDDDKLFLAYVGERNKETGAKSFKLYAGKSEEELQEIEDRFYRKVLNMKYIGSRRDFNKYINREKNYLFQLAKDNRTEEELESDHILYGEIQEGLKSIDKKIPNLNFVSSATNSVNSELNKLSISNIGHTIAFDSATSNADNLIKNTSIISKYGNHNTLIGGDGKLNQIYLAMWSSRNGLTEESLSEVSIFCIEEPEAHLHPHQQRKLAEYLNSVLKGQVVITTHSPQITSEFSPNSMIRLLFKEGHGSIAASDGCSDIIDSAFDNFGYRKSIIAAEAFFADVVFLVEGASEEIFYKTLSKKIGVDLDKLNISILIVDGVGFKTYITILESLHIDWVLRTDNDIFKVPNKDEYRFAGIQRCIDFYRTYYESVDETDSLLSSHESNMRWPTSQTPLPESATSGAAITEELKDYNLFIAENDLENDLYNSLKADFKIIYTDLSDEEIIGKMQNNKATFMFDFVKNHADLLTKLKGEKISLPLSACEEIVTS